MDRRISTLFSAILILGIIATVGIVTRDPDAIAARVLETELASIEEDGASNLGGEFWDFQPDDSTEIQSNEPLSPEELDELGLSEGSYLSVDNLKVFGKLRLGSQAEVASFIVKANGPYSLRYMSIDLNAEGVSDDFYEATNWRVYTQEDRQLVGHGEAFNGTDLRIRFEPQRGQAFLGNQGKTRFILVGTVLKEGDLTLENHLTPSDWLWAPNHYQGSWLHIEDPLTGEDLEGLPSEVLVKSA